MEVAKGVIVREGCFFESAQVTLATGCFINHQCYFDPKDRIVLEDQVHLAPRVQILTATHAVGDRSCRAGADRSAPVTIGRGSWIGTNATILPGVTIARGCIIAAGAVVTADTQADGLYAGVPARRVRDLP